MAPVAKDIACVGAGIGRGFKNTKELKTLNYPEAIALEDKEEWEHEIRLENERMNKYKV